MKDIRNWYLKQLKKMYLIGKLGSLKREENDCYFFLFKTISVIYLKKYWIILKLRDFYNNIL